MADLMALAAELRNKRTQEQAERQNSMAQGGAATSDGGMVGGPMFQGAPAAQYQQPNVGGSILDGLRAYNQAGKAHAAQGAFQGASPAAMGAMSSGGGSNLGSMGLMSSAPAVSFPGAPSAGAGAAGGAGLGAAGFLGLGAKALNDTGISSYGNTMKGQWAGNITDALMGDRDKTGAVGNMTGAIGNFFGGDFGGSFDRGKSALKDIFKLKFF